MILQKIKSLAKNIFGLSPQGTNGAFIFIILLLVFLIAEKQYIQYRKQKLLDIKIDKIKDFKR